MASLLHPLLRALAPCLAAAAAPSVLCCTERFYDLSGSATVLAVGALSLYLPALRARAAGRVARLPRLADPAGWWNWRQLAVTAMAAAWTL